MTGKPHVALDARVICFGADGKPVWQPTIIERWDDGTSHYTKPAIFTKTWVAAITAAHEYLAQPTKLL